MRRTSTAILLIGVAACATREPQATKSGQTAASSLASAIAVARQETPEAEPRRIWADKETDGSGAPSPDGTLLSYTDWVKGALGVRDLRTGENRLLATSNDESPLGGFPETSVFSRDGKRLAYRWVDATGHQLRVIDVVAGSAGRTIVPRSADVVTIVPLQWTADDREVLVQILRPDRTTQVGYANVATGALRGIRTFNWGETGSGTAALSYDGRHLAMSVPSRNAPTESDLVIVTRDASGEVERIENPGVDRIIGWAADGRLFYESTRGAAGVAPASSSLFAVQIRNGKATGAPELVKSDMSRAIFPHVTDDGSLFYGMLSGSYDVYTAGIDVANARVLSPPARATHRLVGFNQGIDWTADGRYAAYLVREGPVPRSPGVVAIRDQESGDVRELRPDLDYINAALRWSPDGRAIVVQATDGKGRLGIFTIDAHTGKATPIVYADPKGGVVHRPQWAPNARAIFYAVADPEAGRFRITRRELETGAEHEIHSDAHLSPIYDLSPDGTTLAVTTSANDGSTIGLVSAAGGSPRELVRIPRPYRVSSVTWARDGKYLLFTKVHSTDGSGEMWRASVENGVTSPIGLGTKDLTGLRLHPDGRRIGFTGGEGQMEVWQMRTTKPAGTEVGRASSRR